MTTGKSRPSADLTAALIKCYGPIMNSLRKQFPHAGEAAYEEAQQRAAVDALRRDGKGFTPASGWEAYLHWLSARRMLDFLNEGLRRRFGRLEPFDLSDAADVDMLAARSMTPQDKLLYEERRERQTVTLTTVLQAYCRKQEASVERLRQKEAYERSMRGQSPKVIAEAMGMLPNTVHQALNRARDTLVNAIREADGRQSVFLTVFQHLGDLGSKGSTDAPANGKPPSNGKAKPPAPAAPPPPAVASESGGESAGEAAGEDSRMAAQLPHFETFADVVLWVIDEGGGMCPTAERLVEYHRDPQAPACADMRYHIGESKCRLCLANLALIAESKSPDSLAIDAKQHQRKRIRRSR